MTDQIPLTTVLRTTARNSDKLLAAELEPLGLNGSRLEVLTAYAEHPDCAMSDAARICDLSVQTASTNTAALASRGWLTIDDPAKWRRSISVTNEGLDALAAAWDASRPLEKRLATLLGAAGIRRLRDTADALSTDANDAGVAELKEDPRFAEIGNAAIGLHYRALMWADARKTDSVPASVVHKWSSKQAGVAQRLVDAGLWKPDGDDYRIR